MSELAQLGEQTLAFSDEVASMKATLSGTPSAPQVLQITGRVASLHGSLDQLQARIDCCSSGPPAADATATDAGADGAGTRPVSKKVLTLSIEGMQDTLVELHALAKTRRRELADALKDTGNAALKARKYGEAQKCYTEAIGVDSSNHVYFANRSACLQTEGKWAEAAADAEEALRLDVGYMKGYLHLVKCRLQLRQFAGAATAYQSAPNGLQQHASMVGMARFAQAAMKDAGNAKFKLKQYPEAVALYTAGISLLQRANAEGCATHHVCYSNRRSVGQG
jgi:hypothetical protein